MAADTKLGAKTVRLELFSVQMFPIDLLREQLAAQGLHVVTAADKAVLDAMANLTEEQVLQAHSIDRCLCNAELARRGAK